MEKRGLTRRALLKSASLASIGVALAAAGCQPKVIEKVVKETVVVQVKETVPVEKVVKETVVVQVTAAPKVAPTTAGPITLQYMDLGDRPTPDHLKIWDSLHPEIKVEILNYDLTRYSAMWAAGAPPDLFMPNGVMLPGLLIRGMLLDLQPYVEVSKLITMDDLAPCHVLHKWNGRTTGTGDLYAVVKDWSTEFSLWFQKAMFEEAKIPLPADDKVLTYQDVAEMASHFVKREGDRQLTWGFDSQFNGFAWTQTIMECLAQAGKSLYDDAFSKFILVDNDEAKKVIKYWVDLMKANIMPSVANPAPSWGGDTMPNKQLAIQQFGYWFYGSLKAKIKEGALPEGGALYATAPSWAGGQRRNPCAAGTCKTISSRTKYKDQAWTFFEWETAKEPGIDGAKSGWGLPALKSQYKYMPNETPFDQQVQKVLQEDLKRSEFVLQYSPFYDAQTLNGTVWPENLQRHLLGEITFDEMLTNIEKRNNEVIKEGIDRLS